MKLFRRALLMAVAMLLFAMTAGTSRLQAGNNHGDGNDQFRARLGYLISPVPLNLKGKNRHLVGLGSYLVNSAGGCNDCHTSPPFAPGGNPFLGEPKQVNAANYLAGGQQFGPFTSRNLTPDENGKPGGLTYHQFRLTMRTGRDLKNLHPEISPLLQVMPWPVYQTLTETDMRAIYEYLRAIPSAQPPAPAP